MLINHALLSLYSRSDVDADLLYFNLDYKFPKKLLKNIYSKPGRSLFANFTESFSLKYSCPGAVYPYNYRYLRCMV